MYTKHFGFTKLPFENVPDPLFFFDEGDYCRIRKRVEDALKAGRGLIVVAGPIGSGKTTLSQMIKSDLKDTIRLIWIAEPPRNSEDLLMYIALELGLKPSITEKVFVLREIQEALRTMNSRGEKCLLLIDESHLASDDALNGIRLLNNLEEGSVKLIQILLLGQLELMDLINRPEMEPFKQRIALLEILGMMDGDRMRHYVAHRIEVAGGRPSLFTETGLEALVLAFSSGGVPRVLNSLCDRSLNTAFERNKTEVDARDVYEATKGLGIGKDVFHYIVTLNSMESKKQAESAAQNDTERKFQAPDNGGAHSVKGAAERINSDQNSAQAGQNFSGKQITDFDYVKSEKGSRPLMKPVLFLLLSAAVLILSLYFYCGQTGSSGLTSCLQELLGL